MLKNCIINKIKKLKRRDNIDKNAKICKIILCVCLGKNFELNSFTSFRK